MQASFVLDFLPCRPDFIQKTHFTRSDICSRSLSIYQNFFQYCRSTTPQALRTPQTDHRQPENCSMPKLIPSYCPNCDNYNPNDLSVDQNYDFRTYSSLVMGAIPKVFIKYCPPCAKYENVSPAMKQGMSLWQYIHSGEGDDGAYRLHVKIKVVDHQDEQRRLESIVKEENAKFGRKTKSHWWDRKSAA